jgi:hypothetical protein
MGYAWPVALIGCPIGIIILRARARAKEKKDIERENAKIAAEMRVIDEHNERIRELNLQHLVDETQRQTRAHIQALSTKRLQKRVRDPYGIIVDAKWDQEVFYFCSQVVLSAFQRISEPYLPRVKEEWQPFQGRCSPPFRLTKQEWNHWLRHFDLYMSRLDMINARDEFRPLSWEPFEDEDEDKDESHHINAYRDICKPIIDGLLYDYDSQRADKAVDVAGLSPHEFEAYCIRLLRESGWQAYGTKASGDQGVDIVATKSGRKAVFQCKKYSKPVGNEAVQEIHAGRSCESADLAFVVSNAEFTRYAQEQAAKCKVHLIHYLQLANLDRFLSS